MLCRITKKASVKLMIPFALCTSFCQLEIKIVRFLDQYQLYENDKSNCQLISLLR